MGSTLAAVQNGSPIRSGNKSFACGEKAPRRSFTYHTNGLKL
jgi:hypothetical protein